MYAGDYKKAAAHFGRALEQACEIADVFVKGRALINIGRNLRRQGRLDDALQAAKRALEYAQAEVSNVLEALSQRNLALVYKAQGEQQLYQVYWDLWQKWKQKSTGKSEAEVPERSTARPVDAVLTATDQQRAP